MMTQHTCPAAHSAHLLREAAQELRETATLPPAHEWEDGRAMDARAAHDEYLAAAESVEGLIAENATMRQGYAAARLEIESLHAQFEAVGAAPWQPIATAPKDGSEILLRSNRGRIANGMWSAANERSGFWAWAYVQQEPVEWMPLPSAQALDAKRYQFLRDGEWRDTDLESFIRLQLNTLWDAKIDAAIAAKQGGANG